MSLEPIKTGPAERFLLGTATILMIWVIWPYAAAVFWAVILAILLDPLWMRMQSRSKAPRPLLALLVIVMVLLVVVLPLAGLISLLPAQIEAFSRNLPNLIREVNAGIASLRSHLPPLISREVGEMIDNPQSGQSGLELSTVLNRIVGWLSSLASSTFSTFISVSITLYVLFFLLLDGRGMAVRIKSYLPVNKGLLAILTTRFIEIVRATIGGVFVIALAQGVVAGVIFALLGLTEAVLLGILTAIAALIPAIGSGLVWVPVSIYLISQGQLANAGILVFCGLFVIGLVDNLLRPRLVGQGTQIPDFMILLTTLGGLELMGATGIVLGPMIAGLCLSLWNALQNPTPARVVTKD